LASSADANQTGHDVRSLFSWTSSQVVVASEGVLAASVQEAALGGGLS